MSPEFLGVIMALLLVVLITSVVLFFFFPHLLSKSAEFAKRRLSFLIGERRGYGAGDPDADEGRASDPRVMGKIGFPRPEQSISSAPGAEGSAATPPPSPLVVRVRCTRLNLIKGTELLHIAEEFGLKLDKKRLIFQYPSSDDENDVEFSMINGPRPGTFDPKTIDQMQTGSVTLFMNPPETGNPRRALEHMIKFTENLVTKLKEMGTPVMLRDKKNESSLTEGWENRYREKVSKFIAGTS